MGNWKRLALGTGQLGWVRGLGILRYLNYGLLLYNLYLVKESWEGGQPNFEKVGGRRGCVYPYYQGLGYLSSKVHSAYRFVMEPPN